MLGDELGVRVVDHLCDSRLVLRVSKEDVWCRERDDLDVDTRSVHVLDSFRHVSHRRSDAEKACTAIGNDSLPAGARAERELRWKISNRLKECFGVEVCVKV